MKVESVFISDIKVTNRRREDFGDIQGLADSIARFGLLHPITLDGDNNLVAGERRLRACRDVLGWMEIDARLYSELTADERREIELEENIRRKDLTPHEVSRNLVELADTAARVIENEFPLADSENPKPKNPKGGRPEKKVSKDKVAERIGVNRQTITNATEHVKAVSDFPELAMVAPTQKDAITVAKNLRALPEGERSEARSQLLKHNQSTLAVLAEKPPMPPPRARAEKTVGTKWREWLTETRVRLTSIFNTGATQLTRQWSNREYDAFLDDLRGFRDDLDKVISELEEQKNELEQQAG
jgi:hypothetical protein